MLSLKQVAPLHVEFVVDFSPICKYASLGPIFYTKIHFYAFSNVPTFLETFASQRVRNKMCAMVAEHFGPYAPYRE